MHLDLEDGPNEVEIHELGHCNVRMIIAGLAIDLCWDQWFNLMEEGVKFMEARSAQGDDEVTPPGSSRL